MFPIILLMAIIIAIHLTDRRYAIVCISQKQYNFFLFILGVYGERIYIILDQSIRCTPEYLRSFIFLCATYFVLTCLYDTT